MTQITTTGQTAIKGNSGTAKLNAVLDNASIKTRFAEVLKENSGAFIASIIELWQSDNYLQQCNPNTVVQEALKAATLKLPINKQLGFAYIVPYKAGGGAPVPQFQLGYKGYIQLAQRTGLYRYLNADVIYEGETFSFNRITGEAQITGAATSDKPVGYFAYFQLLNGFEKCVCWTREKVEAHARRYSKSYNGKSSPWQTNFDAMALKTLIRHLISKYGPMSVEFANAVASDSADDAIEAEVAENANGTPITLPEPRPIELPVDDQVTAPVADDALPADDFPEEAPF